jgi:hypothetical protein
MRFKNPADFTPPMEHGVHKKSGKNKRENQGPSTGKNPRITLFWADRHSRSFGRGDTRHDPPSNAKKKQN